MAAEIGVTVWFIEVLVIAVMIVVGLLVLNTQIQARRVTLPDGRHLRVERAEILRTCPDCGHQVSPSAKSCPNCGRAKPGQSAERHAMGVIGKACLAVAVLLIPFVVGGALL